MSTKHKFTIFAALLVVALCSACQPRYVGPTGARRVGVVGDSITAHAAKQVEGAFPKDQRAVTATPGIDLVDGRSDLVVPMASTRPDVVVVELGINSAREAWTKADAAYIDKILADLADVPCVVWVTPTALEPSYYDHLGEGTIAERIEQMRRSVERRLPSHPNLHLADFGPTQLAHPEWFTADNLHMNTEGHRALATFMQMEVAEHC